MTSRAVHQAFRALSFDILKTETSSQMLPWVPIRIPPVAPLNPDPKQSSSSFQPGALDPCYQNTRVVILPGQKGTQKN